MYNPYENGYDPSELLEDSGYEVRSYVMNTGSLRLLQWFERVFVKTNPHLADSFSIDESSALAQDGGRYEIITLVAHHARFGIDALVSMYEETIASPEAQLEIARSSGLEN